MLAYIVRRLLWMIVLLLIISFLTFLIFAKLPSADPVALRAGRNATPELRAAIKHTFGLDKPFLEQYRIYLAKLVPFDAHQGFKPPDFGYSYQNNVSVKSQILDRIPATAGLALGGMVVWLLVGIPIGIISAIRRGRIEDRLAMGAALVAISAPVYWLGLSVAPSLFLPWLVLATAFAAIYARFLRGNLLEVMAEDYIRTARAKGLPERTVIFRHGVRSAITPIVTILGLDLGILLGGAILTESVFNIPGIGRLAFDSIQKADLPTVEGIVIIGAFFIIALNLVVDILYAFLDPRVRY
jgi:peptide/nickel transport system permease protein